MLDPNFNAVIVVTPEHASHYRDIRLRGLLEHPEAFGEAARSFAEKSLETIQNQIETGIRTGSFILAAVTSDGSMLGVVGLAVSDADKTRHRGLLWGMYVVPEAREQGIGTHLLESLLQRAEQIEQLEQIHLSVVTTNRAAIELYKRLGFTAYGIDPRVIKVNGAYFDEYLMVRGLRGSLDAHPAKLSEDFVMTEFEIRPIQSTDEAAISALLEKLWGGRIIVSRGKELDAAILPGFIAMEGTEIVGLVTLHIHEDACEIVSLDALRKDQGIGTALVSAATQWAHANRCTRVWLITTNDNVGALTFYHKIGFRLVAVHLDAIATARKLKPQIPLVAENGIPIRDEIEFALDLRQ